MTETAPARVWITRDQWGRAYAYENNRHGSTPYVRADAMAEAVEAVERLLGAAKTYQDENGQNAVKIARALLASQGDAK
jgi:hypothetical protein